MPDLKLYRHVADVLLREFETSTAPSAQDGYPEKLLSCIWGIYANIHRLARAVVLLVDNGMAQQAIPVARSALEHTILLHWIIERGDDGVDTMLANQQKRIHAWLGHAKHTELMIPEKIRAELAASNEDLDEAEALKAFEQTCADTGTSDLYAVYSFLCLFTHPTISVSNSYVVTSFREPVLSTTPASTGLADGTIALMAHCLIWAGRDFDRITPGEPRAKDLEVLADELNAAKILPPYDPKQSSERKAGRRARRNARRREGNQD